MVCYIDLYSSQHHELYGLLSLYILVSNAIIQDAYPRRACDSVVEGMETGIWFNGEAGGWIFLFQLSPMNILHDT